MSGNGLGLEGVMYGGGFVQGGFVQAPLPSEETLLITARNIVTLHHQNQPGNQLNNNWSGANPSSGSEQTTVLVTAGSWGTSAVKCLHQ